MAHALRRLWLARPSAVTAASLPTINTPPTAAAAPTDGFRHDKPSTTQRQSISLSRQALKMKFLKNGRVAIITRGRYAGKKVVIVKVMDEGSKTHPFGHALVAGIERYPQKVTRSMSKKRAGKRSKVKPFIKVINYNHLMPTRYTLELDNLKGVISQDTFKEPTQREEAKKVIKKAFEERYSSGKNRWFFTALRF